jgi:hypothetical protein
MVDTMGAVRARTWGGRGTECLCAGERKGGGGGERNLGEASCLCSLSLLLELFYFFSLYSVALSLTNSSRWLLCFGRLSPLAFLDIVAQIQGGKRE